MPETADEWLMKTIKKKIPNSFIIWCFLWPIEANDVNVNGSKSDLFEEPCALPEPGLNFPGNWKWQNERASASAYSLERSIN